MKGGINLEKEIRKGKAKLTIELDDIMWDELTALIEYLQDNPQGALVKVEIGGQAFDA